MKGCKKRKRKNNSVVDTSGHKHRECILWTKKSIITKEGKTSKEQTSIGLIWWPTSNAVKIRIRYFSSSHTRRVFFMFEPPWLLKLQYKCKKNKKQKISSLVEGFLSIKKKKKHTIFWTKPDARGPGRPLHPSVLMLHPWIRRTEEGNAASLKEQSTVF